MYRLEGIVGQKIRLMQQTTSSTISIYFENGSVVVNAEPTKSAGSLPLRFYDFVPAVEGSYLISWNEATLDKRLEIIDVKLSSLRWLIKQIKAKTDFMPPANTG